MYFTHNFRQFTRTDYMAYAGAEKLPNGEHPWIYEIETTDNEEVSIIISGDDYKNETILNVETCNLGSYIITFPGCSRVPAVVADAIIEEFKDYKTTGEAIEAIVSDFDLIKILD